MSINDIKSYLTSRAATPPELLALSDANLQKYVNTAELLLNTFYNFKDVKSDEAATQIIGEEVIFLYTVNFDLNLFYQYEGLKQFNIGSSAVAGTVAYEEIGDLFSRIVKSLLKAAGIEQIIDDPASKVKNNFTWL